MLTTDRHLYADDVPNQPKTQNRTMRIGDSGWEGLGIFGEAVGIDRSKLVNLLVDHCVGRPGIVLPDPLPPQEFADRLAVAIPPAKAEWEAETDPRRKKQLGLKHEGLVSMHAEVMRRITGADVRDDA